MCSSGEQAEVRGEEGVRAQSSWNETLVYDRVRSVEVFTICRNDYLNLVSCVG